MLRSLAIRDIVLIERLDLDFRDGLNVLTGETGAGKSILLDALAFSLGFKVRRDLVRAGAQQGMVVAEFLLSPEHPVEALLADLDLPSAEGELILRRITSASGPSRGFVNDQRVSGDVLRRVGELLVEVHGQHDDRGLLNPRAHRPLLDSFAGLEPELGKLRTSWSQLQDARQALQDARSTLEQAAADADYLRHSVKELRDLDPQPEEEDALDAERRLIRQAAGLTEELEKAATSLENGAEGSLSEALSRLTHIADKAEGRLENAITALDRTLAELAEAQSALTDVREALRFDPGRLEIVEERLFAIRALARKHNVPATELPRLAQDMAEKLQTIDAGEDQILALETTVRAASAAYDEHAARVTLARREAALRLDAAVTDELKPLRMENARFVTEVSAADPGPDGCDQVRFTASINQGAAAGPIDRIASGGELSRFLLALKVQLATRATGLTMIFDEIDRGVGGATANAVGRRLSALSQEAQVLVVTHSPQVAALGTHHFQISKSSDDGAARTSVELLSHDARQDEIARMLAGGAVTDAARAAADALLAEAGT